MNDSQLPLINLFLYLRDDAGLPLTVDQYFLLLEALSKGFGLASQQHLKQLCQMLWIKGKNSQNSTIFNQYFDRYFQQLAQEKERKSPQKTPESNKDLLEENPPNKQTSSNQEINQETNQEINDNVEDNSLTSIKIIPSALRIPLLTQTSNLSNSNSKFNLFLRDFPITERQIQRHFSNLRNLIREGAKDEIDLDSTIEGVCADGFFLKPVFQKAIVNRLELLFLIDVSNSMIPFQPIINHFLKSINQETFNQETYYYFRNCPVEYLYLKPNQPDAELITNILPLLHQEHTIAIIISDAGSARKGYNQNRVELTTDFINLLAKQIRRLLWLNPLPEERWYNTTAEEIANIIKMISLSPSSLNQGIKYLKKGV
jgi:uncharacterized protein with von Willebrand factor type A (vWA) domain